LKIKGRKPAAALIIALVAIVVAVSTAVAWLIISTDYSPERYLSLSNFDAYAEVYFDNAGKKTPVRDSLGAIEVDLTGTYPDKYIGNQRVDAKYKGLGAFYLRLKMTQQWTDNTTGKVLQANAALPYKIGGTPYDIETGGPQDAWFDNRLDDFCIYYADKIQVANANYITKPIIIEGMDITAFNAMKPAGATLKVSFALEAVQINRYPQFWGIDSLPWLE